MIFFVPGLFLFLTGIRSLFEGRRARRLHEQHAAEPWLVEGEWEAEGTTDRPRTTLLAQVSWLAFLSVFVTTLWHAAKYERSQLRFGSFPFYLGRTLDVRFSTRRPIGSFDKMTFTLRCIEERTEVRRTSKGTSTQTVCDQVWADERAFESSWALQEGEVPVSFRLPEGDYGTRLVEAPRATGSWRWPR